MKYVQSNSHQISFKFCIKASIICIVLMIALQTYAKEKSADMRATAAAAALAAVPEAPNNKSNKPDVMVEKVTLDIKKPVEIKAESAVDLSAVAGAIAAFGLPTKVIDKSEKLVEEIPEDIKAAVEKHLLSKIEITKAKTNESSSLVFRAPIYSVKPLLGYVAFVDGELLDLIRPTTNMKLPGYLKLIRDDFVLDSVGQANILANAIEPTISYRLKKIVKPVKIDTGWIIFRNDFFKNYSGLVFTTNEKGKITFVEYIMKINPEDFSYKKQEY